METTEVRIRGLSLRVPSIRIGNCTVIATGRWLKTAQLFDEELLQKADRPAPLALLSQVRESGLPADVFTFAGQAALSSPEFDFPYEWDNLAVVATGSFEKWWTELSQESRKNVRRAAKRGVVVKVVEFDDALVHGIKRIYDETPVRQGRRFWHYQRSVEVVRTANATYLDRSRFIGAFIDGELVGFIKYIRVDETAVLIQILAMEAYRDARPIYALLKHTIELCEKDGLAQLTYGKFDYGIRQESSLTEFKRRTGFTEMRFPRYFVPLTRLGRVAVATGLHLGVRNMIPLPVTNFLHGARSRVLEVIYKRADASQS